MSASSKILVFATAALLAVCVMCSMSATAQVAGTPLAKRGGVDTDGDGRGEIVIRNGQGATQIGRFNTTTGQFVFTTAPDPGTSFRYVGLVDLNGNGKTDLVYQNLTQGDFGDVAIWPDFIAGNAQQTLRTVKRTWDVQAVGDLDGDGFGDLVWRYVVSDSPDTGVSYIWFTNGSAVTQVRKRGGAPLSWKLVGAADLNGDGAADMIYVSPDNQIRALMATPNRTCANLSAGSIPAGFVALKLADFSGNGRADLLLRNGTTGEVRLISLNASGLALPAYTGAPDDQNASCTSSNLVVANSLVTLPATDPGWSFYAADDFDGDGVFDIVWRRPDGTLAMWKMNRTSSPMVIANAGTAPTGYAVNGLTPPTVSITGGSVTKNVAPGAKVHVFADPPVAGTVFDHWTGTTVLLDDPTSAHAIFTMPANGTITLTANFRATPVWSPITETGATIPGTTTASGVKVMYYIPPNPIAVVLRFHGTGGGAVTAFTKVEDNQFSKDLVAAGFGVIALDSDDRINKQWSNVVNNSSVDIGNVRAVLTTLIARGLFTAQTQLVTSGMSNGGAMSPRAAFILSTFAPILPVRASATYCASGNTNIIAQTLVPQSWNLAVNDSTIGASGNADAMTNQQTLASRGIANQLSVNQPAPLYPNRFWRIPGLTPTDSANIYNALKAANLLDANDYLVNGPAPEWSAFLPPPYNSPSLLDDIQDQLTATYAEHKFYSDSNSRVIAFFKAQLR